MSFVFKALFVLLCQYIYEHVKVLSTYVSSTGQKKVKWIIKTGIFPFFPPKKKLKSKMSVDMA